MGATSGLVSVTTEAAILGKLTACKCTVVSRGHPASIEMRDEHGHTFFIPKPLVPPSGYTLAQLNEIERCVAAHGIDLLPLDYVTH